MKFLWESHFFRRQINWQSFSQKYNTYNNKNSDLIWNRQYNICIYLHHSIGRHFQYLQILLSAPLIFSALNSYQNYLYVYKMFYFCV